jgi:hypothetical protein
MESAMDFLFGKIKGNFKGERDLTGKQIFIRMNEISSVIEIDETTVHITLSRSGHGIDLEGTVDDVRLALQKARL